ncbi:hypothetical protein GCM10028868_19110 [Virgibacillus kimchii]
MAKKTDAEVKVVERPKDSNWTTPLEEAITDNTSIVALPHCHWTDGSNIDLERISARCKDVGAALVVDATQSLGVKPFSVKKIKPDFLVSAMYKWLLDPYSFSLMWIAEEHREGKQIEHSWITREGGEDFSRLVDYTENFRPGARRYDVGQTSNFTLTPMAIAALKQIISWEVENIEATLESLTDYLAEEAKQIGFYTIEKQFRSAHIIGLQHPDSIPPELAKQLVAQKVYVSIRGSSIRVSPYLYNTKSDIDRFITSISNIME